MHDLLIIGAGSSGSAIAARATENPNLSVLLLEAGPDYPISCFGVLPYRNIPQSRLPLLWASSDLETNAL